MYTTRPLPPSTMHETIRLGKARSGSQSYPLPWKRAEIWRLCQSAKLVLLARIRSPMGYTTMVLNMHNATDTVYI
jgi:hypothetical protein